MRSVLNHEYVSLSKFTESYREATIVHQLQFKRWQWPTAVKLTFFGQLFCSVLKFAMQVACKVQNTRQCSATVLVWVEDGDNSFTR